MTARNLSASEEQNKETLIERRLTLCRNKVKKLELQVERLEYEKFMFRAFLDTIPDHIYFKDRQSRFTILSKAMMRWFGAKEIKDVIGKTDFDIFTGEHAHEAFNDEQKLMSTAIPLINKEEKETWEGGKITWVSTSKVPIKDEKGKIIGMVGISRDITDKKETEAKLQRYRENLEKAKAETDNILANVKEGLFLLNNEMRIGSQYSRELLNILEMRNLANKKFMSVLKTKISHKNIQATKHYLDLLFDNSHDEEVLDELNPLRKVEVNINNHQKFLTFNFRRIMQQNDQIKELIVTVEDVTKEINLEYSLEEQRNESKRKLDWILSIFNTDPNMLKEFITSVQSEMWVVDSALKTLTEKEKNFENLDGIYRSLHTIKGNASLLEFDLFADQAHRAEDTIKTIKSKMKLMSRDKTDLRKQIEHIHKTFEELKGLIDHIGSIHEQFRPKRGHEQKQFIKLLNRMADSLASRYDKKVELKIDELDATSLPYEHRVLLRDILIQLLRNAVYHGIEAPAERKKNLKPETGHISITGHRENGTYRLEFQDDGQGVDVEKLKTSISESGKWSASAIKRWSKRRLLDSIFLPGISTASSTDLTAGRGMGMDIVKNRIKKIGGSVFVTSNRGEYTRFTINLPV
jgi:PAS domain S-box-containing protein